MNPHRPNVSAWISRIALFASVGLLLLLHVAPARAHGYIVRAIPEDRAVLERAPTRIQYWFSEDLEPAFSTLTLLDANGNVLAEGAVDAENQALMVLRPPLDLPSGAYVVSLRPAFASDGHAIGETRVFFIGSANADVLGSVASDQPVALEIVWRGIVLNAVSLLFGVLTVYSRVLVPAWGSKTHIAGFLPPRVMTRLAWILGGALGLALIGNALALIQNAMVLFNQDAFTILSGNLWNTARISSRFGDVWNWRMLLLGLIAVGFTLTLLWRTDKPRTVAPFWRAMMWGSGLVLGTFAISSHASGSLVMAWVAVLMHWLHLTAVALWTGGLVALALVLPAALRPYDADARRLALLAAMRRFSPLAAGALAVTVTTGVYNALNWLYTPAELTGTTYGMNLLYKSLLVIGLVAVGAVHHIAANPERYARWQALARRFGGWKLTLPLESIFALLVVVSAGWLSATPPPTPDFITNRESVSPSAQQTVNGLTLTMSLAPGGLGVNTYDVRVQDGDAPLEDATVYTRITRPSEDWRGEWLVAEAIEQGLYVASGDEFDEEGAWLALVDVVMADGALTRAVFEWQISDDASVLESIPPMMQHWLALAAVLVALGGVSWQPYQEFMRRLNLNTATAAIILMAGVVTAAVSVWGFQYLGAIEAQNQALLNPPPQQVNPQLPDRESLALGAALYDEACGWQAQDARVYTTFLERLPRTRDEELFAFTQAGFRSLTPCEGTLTDAQRWHIVNHLRTLEPR